MIFEWASFGFEIDWNIWKVDVLSGIAFTLLALRKICGKFKLSRFKLSSYVKGKADDSHINYCENNKK